jgi:single-stranded-DNA-specific exonuclease
MQKVWHIAPKQDDDLVTSILLNRGIERDSIARFLLPSWENGTHDPFIFSQMQKAVDRIFLAFDREQKIVIHGDYDADGVCGTSLLYGALKEVSPNVKLEAYLPDREKDGYGVAMHTVERLAAEGCGLLITVDCGIANGLELERAHELGMDVIVCDHHQLGQHFPTKAIVLHPGAPGESYPNKVLCGTGVAFKLATALFSEARKRGAVIPEGYEKWMLDLVGIATVTDVMPLVGENRVLEFYGLKVLQKTRRDGLKAILHHSGTSTAIDTDVIGFRIGPRLNAAGRMSSARHAFNVLVAQGEEAMLHAARLEELNRERQDVFTVAYKEAQAQIKDNANPFSLAVYAPHWSPGIIGLIAGRLVADFRVPAFAFTKVGEHIVGSGRSIGGLHLVKAMETMPPEIFVRRGGHPQACGLTLYNAEGVDVFRDELERRAQEHFGPQGVIDTLAIDGVLTPSSVDEDIHARLSSLGPFGEGHRPPIFAVCDVTIDELARMGGSGSHLRLTVREPQGSAVKFVGFGFGNLADELKIGQSIDIAYSVGINEWQGRREVQFKIIDYRISSK